MNIDEFKVTLDKLLTEAQDTLANASVRDRAECVSMVADAVFYKNRYDREIATLIQEAMQSALENG